ncbi:hypothetical protein CROQUDRAFT_713415 [Cronartium quercuum f. sp. fusiforme G11]|uniref:Uncharacterized protein n=1 Tax=Cronartium quercuum f. sp. fusiforme G11 TaxID=708437 RepID=A0A9P6NUA9_9BASI|nr:hypothetical protein CROQUDRAFT_713415 [Cronartium quercuum f. sp. fusiforme G11]
MPPRHRLTLPPEAYPSRESHDRAIELVLTRHGTKVASPSHPLVVESRNSLNHQQQPSIRTYKGTRRVKSPLPSWLERATPPVPSQDAYIHPVMKRTTHRQYPAFSRPIPRRPPHYRQQHHHHPHPTLNSSASQLELGSSSQHYETTTLDRVISPNLQQQLRSSRQSTFEGFLHDNPIPETSWKYDQYHVSPQNSTSAQSWLRKDQRQQLGFNSTPYYSPQPSSMESRINRYEQVETDENVNLRDFLKNESTKCYSEPPFCDSQIEQQQQEEEQDDYLSSSSHHHHQSPLSLEFSNPIWNSDDIRNQDRYFHKLMIAAQEISSSGILL